MNCFSERELHVFAPVNRNAIIVLAVAISTSISVLAYASIQMDSSKQSYQSAKNRARQGDLVARQYLDDLAFLNRNETLFLRWLDSGGIGQIDEMAWVELLLDVSASVATLDFKYKLGPVEPIDSVFGRQTTHTGIHESVIELEFEATHGGTVFDFFDEIRKRAPGAYILRDLQLDRIDASDATRDLRNAVVTSDFVAEDSVAAALSELDTNVEAAMAQQEIARGFSGVKVNATLRWYQIELAAQ